VLKSFFEIGEAISDLKFEVKTMKAQGKKPQDFGLMVKNSLDSLLITAPSKMRNAKDYELPISLNESIVETPFLYADYKINQFNIDCILNLVNELNLRKDMLVNKVFKDIDRSFIARLILKIKIPYVNIKFNQDAIADFIMSNDLIAKWDIAFIEGNSNRNDLSLGDIKIKPIIRNYSYDESGTKDVISISQKHRRLGGTGDTKYGLTQDEITKVEELYKNDQNNLNSDGKPKSVGQKAYLKYIEKRNPLLMIYFIDISNESNKHDKITENIFVGFGVAIPKISNSKSKIAKYKINIQKYRELAGLIEGDEDNDEQND
jgi:hypothetical protein